MFKKLIPCAAAVILSLMIPIPAAAFSRGEIMRVVLNGSTVLRLEDPHIGGAEPYIPVRAVCEKLGAVVRWDSADGHAEITSGGKTHVLTGVIRDGRLMSDPQAVADIFNLNTCYEPSLNAVSLNRGPAPTDEQLQAMLAPSDKYNSEDIYWLSRIVEAEARGENYDSRLAVANVVLNRKASGQYPGSVKAVIFDRKHGIQFTPAANGAVYNEPSGLSFLAALDALDGYNNVPGALFFMNPRHAQTLWIEDNREMAFTVGTHTYYY